jgi:hypothetical protein
MNSNRRHSTLISAISFCILIIVFAPMILSSFIGCAHTVEEIVIIDTVGTLDTSNAGPRYIRFISLLSVPNPVTLTTESKKIFGEAIPFMTSAYIPTTKITPFELYAAYYIDTKVHLDSLSIPVDTLIKPNSMWTIALFENIVDTLSKLQPLFLNDSLKRFPHFPVAGDSCYFRFINGVSDVNPQAVVNVYLDTNTIPLFTSVPFKEGRNYILIPTGQHTILITSEADTAKILYQRSQYFSGWEYYTARLNGTVSGANDKLSIDEE